MCNCRVVCSETLPGRRCDCGCHAAKAVADLQQAHRLEQAMALLRELEWSGTDAMMGNAECPVCLAVETAYIGDPRPGCGQHKPGCKLDAYLNGPRG
jgi:hypothetical protein